MKQILALILLAVIALGTAAGQTGQAIYPKDVADALERSGSNRAQLEQVLAHYQAPGDSLKLQAADFLIGNMEGHSYVTYYWKDTLGNAVDFDALRYPTYDSLTSDFKRLEDTYGSIDYDRKATLEDLEQVTAKFLIGQIDYAFKAWRERPWAKNLSFDQFCEYVLPYRGSNEPLEDWRQTFWEKYRDLPTKMTDSTDPLEAARLINDDVKSWFTFDERWYYHPTDQGLAEMLRTHKGRCEDMTNATIYAMRAGGLAVTSDYTPYWADCGNNHAWNAILAPDGRVIPFMGAEANPGDYRLAHRFAKVYRKTYSEQKQNLAFQPHQQTSVPGWLAGKNYKDVTAEYGPTCNVSYKFADATPDSVDIAYLCVFNEGEWRPIDWGRIENGQVTFANVAKDVVLLVGLYLNGKIQPISAPLVSGDDCRQRYFVGQDKAAAKVELALTTARVLEVSTDGTVKQPLQSGTKYELFYWKNGWQSLGKSVAGAGPLAFDQVPAGSLLWLVADGSDKEERVFTIENNKQVWW